MRQGLYLETVAYRNRITPPTFYSWMKRGEAGEPEYAGFFTRVKEAIGDAEGDLLTEVRRGEQGWQSRAWILERRWPAKYGRRADVAALVQQEVHRMLTVAKRTLPDEHMDRLEQALASPDDSLGVADGTRERSPGT